MLRLEAGIGKIRASVTLPGSKSISNRFLLLKDVLNAETHVQNLSNSEDTVVLARSLEMIRQSQAATLDIGQAGTDMRFLTALLAARPGRWTLTGSDRMKERPVGPLVDCLRELGAQISYAEGEGFPPLQIEGKQLRGGDVSIDANVSSQFISALLLVAPLLDGPLVLHLRGMIVSRPYISMTLGLLKKFGFHFIEEERRIVVLPRKRKKVLPAYAIESDWSAASYYYSLCALAPDVSLELKTFHKKSLQADAVVAGLFAKLGVGTVYRTDSILLTKTGVQVKEFDHNFSDCPDIAQTLAVACFGLGIRARLTGLQTLRLKETDRIVALQTELRKLGAKVDAGEDELLIAGHDGPDTGVTPVIETYGDHRMALAFAPLVGRYGRLFVKEPAVVGKSYPAFWEDLSSLGFSIHLQP